MNRIVPLAAAALMIGACSHGDEVDRLRTEISRQDLALQQSQQQWQADAEALRAEIRALRARLGEVATGDPSRPISEIVGELSRRVETAEKARPGDVEARVAAMEARLEAVGKKADQPAGSVSEDRVREMIAEGVAAQKTASQPTKNFAQVMSRLQVSDAEKEAIRQSIVDCKKAQLELLETPTADGRIFAEEVIDAFIRIQDGKSSQADISKLFMEIAGTKLPGDAQNRTYLQVIEEAKKANRENISKLLTKEDQDKLTQAHADWSEFELGEGDPWGALFMQRMEKYQKQKEG